MRKKSFLEDSSQYKGCDICFGTGVLHLPPGGRIVSCGVCSGSGILRKGSLAHIHEQRVKAQQKGEIGKMKESSEIVKCPNCDGVGGWLKDDPPKRAEDRTYREVECPSCHGAGVFGVHGGLELDCDHCFGDGYIKEEVPVVTKRVSCSRCAGLGEISVVTRRVSCSRCAGLGEISDGVGSLYKCSDCDGMGFLYKQVEELPEDSQKEETVLQSCENCAGTGQIIKYSDPETYIREYVECRECKGTGKMPKREETEKEFCPRCEGDGGWLKSRSDGFVTCDLCDGTGKQPEKPQPEPKEQPKIHSKKQKYIGCYGVKVPVTKEEEQLVRLLGSLIEAQGKPAISLFKKVLKDAGVERQK